MFTYHRWFEVHSTFKNNVHMCWMLYPTASHQKQVSTPSKSSKWTGREIGTQDINLNDSHDTVAGGLLTYISKNTYPSAWCLT